MIVYLVFLAEFPTDFDGELKYATLSEERADKKLDEIVKEHPNDEVSIREVELDADLTS